MLIFKSLLHEQRTTVEQNWKVLLKAQYHML
uniref:Uncharacterized protein n=1 Tax=Arundo donax TaxID=35708 RepID=A0A0A9F098_ARUDO